MRIACPTDYLSLLLQVIEYCKYLRTMRSISQRSSYAGRFLLASFLLRATKKGSISCSGLPGLPFYGISWMSTAACLEFVDESDRGAIAADACPCIES